MSSLHIATLKGDFVQVKKLIESGENFISRPVPVDMECQQKISVDNKFCYQGDTALDCAIQYGYMDIVVYLHRKGAKARMKGGFQRALRVAVDNKYYPVVSYVLNKIFFPAEACKTLNPEFIKTFRKAETGDAKSQCELGYYYSEGKEVPKDEKKAFECFEKAAFQNHGNGIRLLAHAYGNGCGVDEDLPKANTLYQQAFPLLKAEASDDDDYSQENLGWMYRYGAGTTKDISQSIQCYEKAANKGSSNAQCNLGDLYSIQGPTQNFEKSFFYYEQAAAQKNASAQYRLGCMYYNGDEFVAKNEVKAAFWFEKAAYGGHAGAQDNFGALFSLGYGGIEINPTRAFFWIKKSAEQNHVGGLSNLATLYDKGLGTEINPELAVLYYKQAAELGDSYSQYMAGTKYYYGSGVPEDDTQAIFWLQKAADQNYPGAQYRLGCCYENLKDYAKALTCYQTADSQGDINALIGIGNLYYSGKGFDGPDYKTAKLWFDKAAIKGVPAAGYYLGLMCIHGFNLPEPNVPEGIALIKNAATKGHLDSQLYLGDLYYRGQLVEEDEATAFTWYEKAAAQGNSTAEYTLGVMYELGQGVKKDIIQSAKFYLLAAEHGNIEAYYAAGHCYYCAQGIKNNDDEAVKWLEKAAAHNHTRALRLLGQIRLGVSPPNQTHQLWRFINYPMALSCFEKAANQGDSAAEHYLGLMYIQGVGFSGYKTTEGLAFLEKSADKNYLPAQLKLIQFYKEGKIVKKDPATLLKWTEKAAAQGDLDAKKDLTTVRVEAILAGAKKPTVQPAHQTTANQNVDTPESLTLQAAALLPEVLNSYLAKDEYRQLLNQALTIKANFLPAIVALRALEFDPILRDRMAAEIKNSTFIAEATTWLSANKTSLGVNFFYVDFMICLDKYPEDSAVLLAQASVQGIAQATDALAKYFANELGGLLKNKYRALTLYIEAAEKGFKYSAFMAANLCIYIGDITYLEKGIKFAESVQSEEPSAYLLIGHAYHYYREHKNYTYAMKQYLLCITAFEEQKKKYNLTEVHSDLLRAQLTIARCYFDGGPIPFPSYLSYATEWAEKVISQTSKNKEPDIYNDAQSLLNKISAEKRELSASSMHGSYSHSRRDPLRDTDGIPWAVKDASARHRK